MASLHGSGWFACPNSVFDQCETAYEIVVVTYLLRRAGPDGACWPSLATTARDTKLSKRTVQNVLDSLEKRGMLSRSSRNRDDGGHSSNEYRVTVQDMPQPIARPAIAYSTTRPRRLLTEGDPSEGKETPSLSPLTTELTKLFGKHLPRRFFETVGSLRSRFGEDIVLAALRRHVTTVSAADNPLMYLNKILEREALEIPSQEAERVRREQFERGVEEARQARLAREAAHGIDPGRDGTDAAPAGSSGRVGSEAVLVQVRQVPGQRGRDVPQAGRPEREAVGAAVYSLPEGRRDMGGLEAADRAIRRDDGC